MACGAGSGGGGLITYAAGVLTVTAGTYYLPLGGGGGGNTTESTQQTLVNVAATVLNLGYQGSAAIGMGNTATITLRDNGSNTALSCQVSGTGAGGTACSDTTDTVTTTVGHLYDWQFVTTGTIAIMPFVHIAAQFGAVSSGSINAGTANQTAYYSGAGSTLVGGGPGTAGQCWTSNGSSSAPSFQACSGGGSGGVTFFQAVTAASTNIAPSMTVNAGSLLISVGTRNAALANPCTPTDTQLNTWTQAAWGTTTGGFPNQANIAWAIAGSSGADVITSCASALGGVIAAEIRATLGSTTDTAAGSTAGSSPPPLTMSATGDIMLTAVSGCNAASDFSVKVPEIIIAEFGTGNCGALALIQIPANLSGTATSSLANVNAAEPAVTMAFKSH